MPFNINNPINQGNGPLCGAACAVFVSHWLANQDLNIPVDSNVQLGGTVADEIRLAMDATRTCSCTDNLGSTPANIAAYLKRLHPHARIYAPTEMLSNWSTRPWYPALRLGLQTSCNLNWSCGCACALPGGVLGVDYLTISMISKSLACPLFSSAYYEGHFIVHTGVDRIMDPNGVILIGPNKDQYLSGGYFSRGWASVGLDLHIYR